MNNFIEETLTASGYAKFIDLIDNKCVDMQRGNGHIVSQIHVDETVEVLRIALVIIAFGSPMAVIANIYLLVVIPTFIFLTIIMKYHVSKRTKVMIKSPEYYNSSLANMIGNGVEMIALTVYAMYSIMNGFDVVLLNIFSVLVLTLCFYRIPFYTLIFIDKPTLAFKWIAAYSCLVQTFKNANELLNIYKSKSN